MKLNIVSETNVGMVTLIKKLIAQHGARTVRLGLHLANVHAAVTAIRTTTLTAEQRVEAADAIGQTLAMLVSDLGVAYEIDPDGPMSVADTLAKLSRDQSRAEQLDEQPITREAADIATAAILKAKEIDKPTLH